MKAPVHPRQQERLAALRRYDILDTPREADFDQIAELAALVCDVPVAVVNFIDADRQWYKAEVGLGVSSTPLETSICSHVILEKHFVEIRDTLEDPRLRGNPLCFGDGGFRFYAGAVLQTEDGLPLGTLCVLDYKPRDLTQAQQQTVRVLAAQVMKQLDLRRALNQHDVLRKEIYHRVTNSLSTVASLVRLQKQQTSDTAFHDALQAIENRIYTIAHLHRELCESETSDSLDLQAFIQRIGNHLASSSPPNVTIDVDVEHMTLNSRQASGLAIIINEFITNSIKHAFPDNRRGKITIQGELDDRGRCVITCHDNGIGNPSAFIGQPSSGLGAVIIEASASQLGADCQTHATPNGYRLDLSFPLGAATAPAKVSCAV